MNSMAIAKQILMCGDILGNATCCYQFCQPGVHWLWKQWFLLFVAGKFEKQKQCLQTRNITIVILAIYIFVSHTQETSKFS